MHTDIPNKTVTGWFDRERIVKSKALLVAIYQGETQHQKAEEHLQELELLTKTFGNESIEMVALSIRTFTAATFISKGKIDALLEAVEKFQVNLVIFDDEITPAQQRNLEEILRVPVIDRTEVILGVFADHARTKEAKLQVELAQIKYVFPRLKRMWTHLGQQTGGGGGISGGGYLKGAGERQIEIDKRLLNKRIDRLQSEIKEVREVRKTQRVLRERRDIPVFAIVGYTNAGKSTLMNALTHAEVLVEDKLFATLDTTTRKYCLPNKQDILLIDTVGFIRKLPHLLVHAFKSTLEEAVQAEYLLHIVDASHPNALEQAQTTLQVIKELNAGNKPVITLLNKIDRVQEIGPTAQQVLAKLKLTYPRSIELSALTHLGFDHLIEEFIHVLQSRRVRLSLRIPQSEYHLVSSAIREGQIFHQTYEGNDVLLEVEIPGEIQWQFKKYSIQDVFRTEEKNISD